MDLFVELGEVESAVLAYDANGTSTGVAHVTYKDPSSALKAHKSYNGVTLDGQEMIIEFVATVKRIPVQSRLQH